MNDHPSVFRSAVAGQGDPVEHGVPQAQRLVAEALGTGFLLIAVVGSGILASRLSGGNVAIALLANSLATAAALYVLIESFSPLSGAHLNPLVTGMVAYRGEMAPASALAYVAAQLAGAFAGVGIADAMFDVAIFSLATNVRSGASQLLSEFVSTFGLIGLVWICAERKLSSVAAIVAAYIGGGFWFTAAGFSNPAVSIARAFTDTFAGIRLVDVPGFLLAQAAGGVAAVLLFGWLLPNDSRRRRSAVDEVEGWRWTPDP